MEKLKFDIFKEHKNILKTAEIDGKITVFVTIDGDIKGLILFGQKIKKEAPKAIEALRKVGINIAVLTDDIKVFC